MASKARVARVSPRLSKVPVASRIMPDTARDFAAPRAFLVFVLAPMLIFFMSRKAVDRVSTTAHIAPGVSEEWPSAAGALVPGRVIVPATYDFDPRAANLIYSRAMGLARRYDSRPYWNHPKLAPGVPTTRYTADLAIEHLIPCESMGKPINRVDTNGKMSYGILQFQDWDEWERVSGITGDPDNRADSIRMAEWAIQNGMINHWTCASILKIT